MPLFQIVSFDMRCAAVAHDHPTKFVHILKCQFKLITRTHWEGRSSTSDGKIDVDRMEIPNGERGAPRRADHSTRCSQCVSLLSLSVSILSWSTPQSERSTEIYVRSTCLSHFPDHSIRALSPLGGLWCADINVYFATKDFKESQRMHDVRQ